MLTALGGGLFMIGLWRFFANADEAIGPKLMFAGAILFTVGVLQPTA